MLKTGELIGFIGLAYQDYKADFTPATDIGWRLKKSAWGNGYATEGAKKCLEFGFKELNLDKIIATCTEKNGKSENVMKKIGMKKIGKFNHPKLKEYPALEKCICYEINIKDMVLSKLFAMLILCGFFLLGSCKNVGNQSDNIGNPKKTEIKTTKENSSSINKELLVGSWKDTSESALHFTLFADGTARSDNMKTLVYEKWRLANDQITFTIKSIGNKTSSVDEEVFEIQELREDKLIIKKGSFIAEYTK